MRDDNLNHLDHNEDGTQYLMDYMRNVLAAADALNIDEIRTWEMPGRGNVGDDYDQFEYQVQRFVTKVQIRASRKYKVYSVTLDDVTKSKIHFFIDQIRDHLNKSNLVERKKNSLFNKLNAFSADVDRARTKFDNAMLVAIDIAHVVKEYGESLKPVKELMDSVTELIGAIKSSEPEQSQLPPPAEQKRIEPPKLKQVERPFSRDMDEDIPF
ncbi:hypothetical protein U8C35_06285 [Sinorhizobium medicae]|uniref:hypothetical protein n=1 Tax=Sinorhizobium medicae TaxID=110321 RepID=UPI002AF6B149|nr:hypothetical protein [Sinorhizobium medicae]WQO60040.1 hypothetical protein U8C35_06285 [Sinorhizobium medicae]